MAKFACFLPAALARGARCFARWRDQRTTHRIPEQLWSLAARLGAEHGVSRTCRALGVEYHGLKRRVEAAGESSSGQVARQAFVEIVSSPGAWSAEHVVELESASGLKMRIQTRGGSTPDLAALWRLFLERAT